MSKKHWLFGPKWTGWAMVDRGPLMGQWWGHCSDGKFYYVNVVAVGLLETCIINGERLLHEKAGMSWS